MKDRLWYKIIIAFMIIVISLLHYFAGTPDSPAHNFYKLLYYIPIILAAFKFGFKGGVIVSLVSGFIYSPFMLLSIGLAGWKTVNEFLDVLLFFVVGTVTGILAEKKNISMQKLDNELGRYVMLENYTNSIIESIKSGIVAVNNDLLITMVNNGAMHLLNLDYDVIGKSITEIFNCCDFLNQKVLESINDDEPKENMEAGVKIGDREATLKISVFPLSLENSRKGLVIIIDDITEVKRLQMYLQRNEQLAALGELSSGIAHEIRNPLGIIKAIEQTMRNELKMNGEAVKELEIIDEEVERANRVVKALMEFGKPLKNKKIPYSVNTLMEDVLTITNKYMAQHNINVEFIKNESIPGTFVDIEQMKQAFVNIIFNAVQAMPDGRN